MSGGGGGGARREALYLSGGEPSIIHDVLHGRAPILDKKQRPDGKILSRNFR